MPKDVAVVEEIAMGVSVSSEDSVAGIFGR